MLKPSRRMRSLSLYRAITEMITLTPLEGASLSFVSWISSRIASNEHASATMV